MNYGNIKGIFDFGLNSSNNNFTLDELIKIYELIETYPDQMFLLTQTFESWEFIADFLIFYLKQDKLSQGKLNAISESEDIPKLGDYVKSLKRTMPEYEEVCG